MKLKALFEDDSAVSPVIGVILMVAITVILAAVIGTFVLGLGQNIQSTAPQASFSFEFQQDAAANNNAIVSIIHDGGDTLEGGQLTTKVDGDAVSSSSDFSYKDGDAWGSEIAAGSTEKVVKTGTGTDWSGETVEVIWKSDSGENSATVGESTAPN
ncbi:type IV pilin [Halorussus ruber]|uniref:type IV pilin n=1 Tax=Halorussus ruber TaxID=1126238 RepID=UPI00109305AE|nr:type IV pilin N-terminal domain-containing protein [Halorussus ruber]